MEGQELRWCYQQDLRQGTLEINPHTINPQSFSQAELSLCSPNPASSVYIHKCYPAVCLITPQKTHAPYVHFPKSQLMGDMVNWMIRVKALKDKIP